MDPEAGLGRVYVRARQRLVRRVEGDGWMKYVDDVGRSDLRLRWSVGLRWVTFHAWQVHAVLQRLTADRQLAADLASKSRPVVCARVRRLYAALHVMTRSQRSALSLFWKFNSFNRAGVRSRFATPSRVHLHRLSVVIDFRA